MGKAKAEGPKKGSRKRRGRGEGGIHYREDRQLWCGSVSLGYHADGRRNRKVVYADTKKGVVDEIEKLRAKRRGGVPVDSGRMNVSQLLLKWHEASKGRTGGKTYEERESVIRVHLTPRVGGLKLGELASAHVESLYSDLARDGVTGTTAHHVAGVLCAALKYARKRGWIDSSPADGVHRPARSRREMLCLDAAQSKLLLAEAGKWSCGPLVALALGSAARQGELLALQWDDLDLDAGTLTVRRSLSWTKAGGFELKEPKTRAGRRTVTLPAFAVEAMRTHRAAKLKGGTIALPVFSTRYGAYYRRRNVLGAFKSVLARVPSLPQKLRFHDLRHTVASLLLSAGQSLRAVSQRLGHSDPGLTLRVYAHCLPGDDAQLSAGLDRLIG